MPKQLSLRDLLADLVAFQTESGQYDATAELLSFVKYFADQRGYHTTEYVSNDFPSLVVRSRMSEKPTVTLQAHIDVVKARDDLYRLVADGDKLYGRGVYDMKFAVACYLKLLDELTNDSQTYNFALMLTSDEEIGGQDGVRYVLDQDYQTDVCVLPDGGDNWEIEERAKGACLAVVTAKGITAHGSRPWEGDNASQKVINAVHEMQKLDTGKRDGVTVAITQMKSDTAMNQIPEAACVSLDIRFMTMDEYEDIHTKLNKIAKKHGCDVEMAVFIEPMKTNLQHPLVELFTDIAAKMTDRPVKSRTSLGASDGRFFARKDIPTIIMRPEGGGAHSDDEWISEASMEQYYEVLKQYIQQVATLK